MFKYAQIDLESGRCVSVSYLSGEIEAEHMLPLTEEEDVQPGDILQGDGTWLRPAPPPPPVPGPTPEDRIAQLEAINAELNGRVEASESAILALMDVLMGGGE